MKLLTLLLIWFGSFVAFCAAAYFLIGLLCRWVGFEVGQ